MAERTFGSRLAETFAASGQLCVGIDPHPFLLEEWGLPDSADGLSEFGLRVVDAVAGRAGIVKPQVAFFERHGSAGYAALERILESARAAGLVVIADAKRGDVGTSVEAYGQAWLTPGSPLEADAMTISAYQGVGSIAAPVARAQANRKGLFVLAATSNPESVHIQTARVETGRHEGETVAGAIVTGVMEINSSAAGSAGSRGVPSSLDVRGSIGVVLGATVPLADYGISVGDLANSPATPVLAPGFGHQGARFSDIRDRYGSVSPSVVVAMSRGLLSAGPGGIAEQISRTAGELAKCLA